jgi:hypothetical protein
MRPSGSAVVGKTCCSSSRRIMSPVIVFTTIVLANGCTVYSSL